MFCNLCPHSCGAVRSEDGGAGVCGEGTLPRAARAAPHFWEEPPISGENGTGAVFFTGCNLRCVYCQNGPVSRGEVGRTVTVERLREIYRELIEKGVHSVSLITASHFLEPVLESLTPALPVPVVWNSSGFESVEALRRLRGKVQIYLPDYKYSDPNLAERYSKARDYPEIARKAIEEMVRQTGPCVLEDGLLKSGTVIRHLVLPGALANTFGVIDWVAETFRPGEVLFSLMSQYTPFGALDAFPELRRRLTEEEYDCALAYVEERGLEGFFQELSSAKEEYTPDFDLTGV